MLSPMSGKPREPGGSVPLHLGFFHLRIQYVIHIITKLTTHRLIGNIFQFYGDEGSGEEVKVVEASRLKN